MAYPTSVDVFPTLVDGTPAYAAYFNNIHTAVLAIEAALGHNPKGAYPSVAAALAVANTTPGPAGPTGGAGPSGPAGPQGSVGVNSFLFMGA